jgi:hypothetical protein
VLVRMQRCIKALVTGNTAQLTALARRKNEPCNARKQKGAGTFVTVAGIRVLIEAAAARPCLVCAKGVKCM